MITWTIQIQKYTIKYLTSNLKHKNIRELKEKNFKPCSHTLPFDQQETFLDDRIVRYELWHDNGIKNYECNYKYSYDSKNNVMNGKQYTFDIDGNLEKEFNFLNEKKEGLQYSFSKNYIDCTVSNYKDGLNEGAEIRYHDDKIISYNNFIKGKKEGMQYNYFGYVYPFDSISYIVDDIVLISNYSSDQKNGIEYQIRMSKNISLEQIINKIEINELKVMCKKYFLYDEEVSHIKYILYKNKKRKAKLNSNIVLNSDMEYDIRISI